MILGTSQCKDQGVREVDGDGVSMLFVNLCSEFAPVRRVGGGSEILIVSHFTYNYRQYRG